MTKILVRAVRRCAARRALSTYPHCPPPLPLLPPHPHLTHTHFFYSCLIHGSFFHCCLFIVNLNNFSSFFLSFSSLLTASNALLIRVTLTPIPPDPLTAYVHPHTLPCFITLVAPYPHTRSPSVTLVSISINCFSTSPLPFLISVMSYLYRGSHHHLIPLTFYYIALFSLASHYPKSNILYPHLLPVTFTSGLPLTLFSSLLYHNHTNFVSASS